MDPLTQGALGATVGQAFYGRTLGRQALVWGAVVGMAPDLDIIVNATSPMAEWLWHRGPTHALWFGPVVGPLVGWLLWRWKGGSLRDWVGLSVLALFTHPLLDVFTTYGTQLFSPFSRHRFALDSVAIIDPAYTLLLVAGIAVGLWRGLATRAARMAAWTALGLTTGYLLLGVGVNARALNGHAAGAADKDLFGTTCHRRFVDADTDSYGFGLHRSIADGETKKEPLTAGRGKEAQNRTTAALELNRLPWT